MILHANKFFFPFQVFQISNSHQMAAAKTYFHFHKQALTHSTNHKNFPSLTAIQKIIKRVNLCLGNRKYIQQNVGKVSMNTMKPEKYRYFSGFLNALLSSEVINFSFMKF